MTSFKYYSQHTFNEKKILECGVVWMAITNLEFEYPIALLPKQMAAFELTKAVRYTLYSGAVGAGKTLLAAHVAIEACLNYPNAKGFLGCLTYTQLKNVLFTTFKEEIYKYQETMNENDIPIKLLKSCLLYTSPSPRD